MNDQKKLSVEGIISSGADLNNASASLTEVCTELYNYVIALRESETFKTVVASTGYFANIDELNAIVPKFSEAILRFSKFLTEYVVQNYTETDDETKLKIEANLASSIEQLQALGSISEHGLDYTKISNTAINANQGNFISSEKIHKQYFEDGELQYITREDGSIQIVKDGTTMGFTTADGIVNIPKVENTPVVEGTENVPLTREQLQQRISDLTGADTSNIGRATREQMQGMTVNPETEGSLTGSSQGASIATGTGLDALTSQKQIQAAGTVNAASKGAHSLTSSEQFQTRGVNAANDAYLASSTQPQSQGTGAISSVGAGLNSLASPAPSQIQAAGTVNAASKSAHSLTSSEQFQTRGVNAANDAYLASSTQPQSQGTGAMSSVGMGLNSLTPPEQSQMQASGLLDTANTEASLFISPVGEANTANIGDNLPISSLTTPTSGTMNTANTGTSLISNSSLINNQVSAPQQALSGNSGLASEIMANGSIPFPENATLQKPGLDLSNNLSNFKELRYNTQTGKVDVIKSNDKTYVSYDIEDLVDASFK